MLRLPLHRAIKLIDEAQEKETKEVFYRLWLIRYPNYTEKNFETFEQFYDKNKPKIVELDMRSKDEIMREILEIENK